MTGRLIGNRKEGTDRKRRKEERKDGRKDRLKKMRGECQRNRQR